MSPVTEGTIPGLLAGAKGVVLFLSDLNFFWSKGGTFMGTITERLLGGFSAGAPPVITRLKFEYCWGLATNLWLFVTHSETSSPWSE
jgi:hypothetical protein